MVRMALQEDSSMVRAVRERTLGPNTWFQVRPHHFLVALISLCLSCPTYKVGLITVPPSYGCFENGTN